MRTNFCHDLRLNPNSLSEMNVVLFCVSLVQLQHRGGVWQFGKQQCMATQQFDRFLLQSGILTVMLTHKGRSEIQDCAGPVVVYKTPVAD